MNRSTFAGISVFVTIWCAVIASRSSAGEYPEARRSDHVDSYFGETVADPYRWMEDIDSPETAGWVAAERATTAAALKAIPERDPLFRRLGELWNFPHFGLPQVGGTRMFFTENSGLQNQAVLKVQTLGSRESRVLLDPNTLAADGTVALTLFSPTEDGSLVGYALATAGSDWKQFRVRDVETGRDLPDVIDWVKFSGIEWTRDGKGFFYSRFPAVPKGDKLFGKIYGEQLYYHRLGTPQAADTLIFELKEHPDWFFSGSVTDDGRYLVIHARPASENRDSISYVDLVDTLAPRVSGPVVGLLTALDATYSVIGNKGPVFFVKTTKDAPRGRVVAVDLSAPAGAQCKVPVPEGEDTIAQAAYAGDRLVVLTQHDVQSVLTVCSLDGSGKSKVALPGPGAVTGISSRAGDGTFYFGFSSFLNPPSILSADASTGRCTVLESASTAFRAGDFETRQVFYASRDGTRIPMFITARKGLKLDGRTPAWLYGYGGFNISSSPTYAVPPAVWLEMGGLYAVANLRGGGEYGETWHQAGSRERKQNVFDDFITAADFLVGQGYTRRDRLMIEGRSNGGLLVGAVLNQRPDLCAVALPGVGVMDMLRYHTFTVGGSWAGDYGTSGDAAGFKYLRAYSPVHTVRSGAKYPPVFITTGDHDDRVFPAHSYKYAAELQHAASLVPGSGPILIRIESNAGHGGSTGSSPVSKVIAEWADKLGFAAHYMPAGTLELPK